MTETCVKDAVQQMSRLMAHMYYHLTKEMIDAYGDSAKDVIANAMAAFGRARGRRIASAAKADGAALTIENLDRYYDMPITVGWDVERTYYSDHKDNITPSCTFAGVWKELDWAEVGHIYCLVDAAIREGYNENIRFCPIKNILKGDDCCQSRTIYLDKDEEGA